MSKHRPSWNLILLLWLAFGLRVYRLGCPSLWYDEGYSVYLGAHLPLGQALDLTVRDIVPPLYYLLLRVWLPFTGTSEYALRFLSVLFGVVAVALMARIGRHLVPSTREGDKGGTGLLSAALAAIAPVLIWLSQDARMYGPLVTWSLLATWGLLRAVAPTATPKTRQRGWALFVGAGLAALYTHTVAVFWLAGQVVFGLLATLWQTRGQHRQREWVTGAETRRRWYETLVALGLMALGYLPWVIVAIVSYRVNTGYWPGYLPPPYLWRTAWDAFVGGQHLTQAQTDLAAVWFGAVALLSWVVLLFKRPRVAVYLACYLVIPLLAMGVVFQHTPKLAPRYPTAMAPALFLALAAGGTTTLRLIRSRRVTRVVRYVPFVVALSVVPLSLRADANLYFDPDYGKDDWRAAASYVRDQRQPDEAVLLISGHAFPVFAYYYGWEGWYALPDDLQLDVTHVLDYPTIASQLNQMLAGASGVWLVLWQDEVVDPTGLVPALLGDVGCESPAPTFQGSSAGDRVRLRHFELEATARFPDGLPVQHPLQQVLAPGLTVLGYTLPAEPLPADAELGLRVFWQADEPLQGAYAASLRLFDPLDQEWARQDALLAGPWYFTERWSVGTPVMGHYTATLPLGTPPGTYTPALRVYRGGETIETLQLAPLVITRPLSMPSTTALGLPQTSIEAGELSLVGVGFDQQTVTPCQDWYLSLAWQTAVRPTQDYGLRLSAGSDQVETVLAPDYPTSHWQPGDVWRTRHHLPVNCRALDGTVPAVAQLLGAGGQPVGDPLDLGEITVVAGRQFTLPADLTGVVDVRLADAGTLAGYRLEEDRVQPGENLKVTLYWRASRATEQNYSIFVHLESDRVWAQHDGWPVNGQKPTSTWARKEVIADQHIIPIGADVPPDSYRLVVGMYNAVTLQPLAAFEANGQPIEEGRIVLQSIVVYVP